MDTDVIFSTVCAYGAAKCGGYTFDAQDHIAAVKRLLNEADEEHKLLLAENACLVDAVNEARKEAEEQARLNGMGAEREVRLMARITGLEKALRELHDATQLVSVGNYDQEAHDIAVSRARAALEKKHEGT